MGIPLFDAHCDTSYNILSGGLSLRSNSGHNDLLRGSRYSPRAQIFAIWDEGGNLAGRYSVQLENLKRELASNSDIAALCTSGSQAREAFSQGKTAAFISVEGAELLECSEERLEDAKNDGICAVNITWNFENALSGSNAQGASRGLTEKGKIFVRKCGALGILVDVSHISEPAFWDVISEGVPVMASHSDSDAVYRHKRNLTDAQFEAIRDSGGVAGINLYSEFLGEKPDISTVIEHIEHFLSLGGEKSVGIGADFDGCESLPAGICGVEDMEKIYNELLKMNYSQTLTDDIFFNNFMRIID